MEREGVSEFGLKDFIKFLPQLKGGVFEIRTDSAFFKGRTADLELRRLNDSDCLKIIGTDVLSGHLNNSRLEFQRRILTYELKSSTHYLSFKDGLGCGILITIDNDRDHGNITFYSQDHIETIKHEKQAR